jgi:flagellar hook-associated protein 1 FlgK
MANQIAISVTSHNISNVNNPDYSRQEVILGVKTPIKIKDSFLGRGVSVDGIKRSYDKFLTDMLVNQENTLGKSSILKDIISQIEEVFNEANREGLNGAITKFFNALEDLSVNPSDTSKRIVLINEGNSLVSQFKITEKSLEDIKSTIHLEINDVVKKVNSIGKELTELNKKIAQLEAWGNAQVNDLRDKRDALLKELSGIVNVTYYENSDKSLVVMIGMRNLVNGGVFNELSMEQIKDTPRFKLDGIDISDRITGGKLSGLVDSLGLINNEVLYKLRKLAAGFSNEFNIIHKTGYDLNSNLGKDFFTSLSDIHYEEYSQNAAISFISVNNFSNLKFDEYYINIKAGNTYDVVNKYNNQIITSGNYISGSPIVFDGISVTISGAVSEGDSFFISPLKTFLKDFGVKITDPKEVALASLPNSSSDNTNLLALLNLKNKTLGSLNNQNVYEFYNTLASKIGVLSTSADANLKFDQNLYNEISNKKIAAQGVNLDEEAVNLIRYQRSFEAAAKVIQVANELYDTLVKLL